MEGAAWRATVALALVRPDAPAAKRHRQRPRPGCQPAARACAGLPADDELFQRLPSHAREPVWAESKIHVTLRLNSSWRLPCERQNVEFAADSTTAVQIQAGT